MPIVIAEAGRISGFVVLVTAILRAHQTPAVYKVWTKSHVGTQESVVNFYRLQAGDDVATKMLLLVKYWQSEVVDSARALICSYIVVKGWL
jgi:hypothetical protein